MKNSRKYFSPISDVGFKKLFASKGNEDLRLQLLNSIITDGSPVVSAELLDPVHAIRADTTAIFDLYCQREDGSRIIVEMQQAASPAFLDRALAYSALALIDQWHKGWKYDFDRIYFIGILNRIVFHETPDKPFTTVKLMSADAPHFVTSEKYLQIFVELPKLASVTLEDMSPGELFLDAMRRLSSFEDRPLAYQDKNLDRLFTESVYGGLTDEEKAKHDKQMTTEQDYLDSIKYEAAYNYSRGLEAGLEQGSESARIEVARKMKSAGMNAEFIVKFTDLSVEAVQAL